jgi:transposase-like protein
VIGADRYQRSASRTTHRNGSRSRLLSTKAGDVELRIPKLREGRASRRCWNRAAGSTGPCWRW